MRATLPSILLALAGSGAAFAQAPTPVERIDQEIARAERDLADARAEDAASRLRRARVAAAALFDEERRAATTARIDALIDANDPLAARRAKAEAIAADALLSAANVYAERGWLRVASALCAKARPFDPTRARAAVDAIHAKSSATGASGAQVELDWSGGETVVGARDGWSIAADRFTSCELGKSANVYLCATKLPARIRAKAQLVFDSTRPRGGLVIGYKHDDHYVAVDAWLEPGGGGKWIARRRAGGTWQPLGNGEFAVDPKPAAKTGTIVPLVVDSTRGGLRVQVGASAPVVVTPPALGDATVPAGYFGLIAYLKRGTKGQLGWRDVTVETLAPLTTKRRAGGVEELVRSATEAAAAGDAERAVMLSWDARAAAQRLRDAPARKREIAKIDRSLAALDESAKATRTAHIDAAKKLVPIGMAYVRKKWFATGLALLEHAQELHAPTAMRKLSEARGRAGITNESLMERFFTRRDRLYGSQPWSLRAGELASPPIGTSTVATRSTQEVDGDARIRVDMLLSAEDESKAALLFGVRPAAGSAGSYSYYIFEIMHARGASDLRLFHYDPDREESMRSLIHVFAYFSRRERAEWIEIAVEKAADRLRIRLGESEWHETRELPASGDGFVGCFVSGNSGYKEPVLFRNLRVER